MVVIWWICFFEEVGVSRKIGFMFLVCIFWENFLYFLGGQFIMMVLFMFVLLVVVMKVLMLKCLMGLVQFISMMGVWLLVLWNLCIQFSILWVLMLNFKVCLQVCWIIGFLVIGLENGIFSLRMLMLLVISVCSSGMVSLGVGLLVVMKVMSVLCFCLVSWEKVVWILDMMI